MQGYAGRGSWRRAPAAAAHDARIFATANTMEVAAANFVVAACRKLKPLHELPSPSSD
jgi:hypothetical protein